MFLAEWLKQTVGKHFHFYLLAVILLILIGGVAASALASRSVRRESISA